MNMKKRYPEGSDPFDFVTRIIFETGAYSVNTKDPFIYTSRKIGADYIDMGMIQSYPKAWKAIIDYLVEIIQSTVDREKIDRISGGEVRDLVFSIPVARKLQIPHVIIRKEAKTYGAKGRFVGEINSGDYVVHVADLMTVGTSSHEWVSALREEAEAKIEFYFEGFDRLQGGGETLERLKPPVKNISLARRDDKFYDIGTNHEYIQDRTELNRFHKNPEEWSKDFLMNNPNFIINHTRIISGHIDPKRKEGLEVLTIGYPELSDELGPTISKLLEGKGMVDSIPEIGYRV